MNLFFRILLAVYAFCLAIISAIAMLIIARPEIFYSIYTYLENDVFQNRGASIALFLVAFVFFILSITFLLSGFRSNKDKKSVSKHTNIGEIKISLNTVENIALSASRKVNGIKDTKARVTKFGENVAVAVNAIVMPDVNIPAISEDIQGRVKRSIEETSGICVNDVKVIVENVYSGAGYKSRVE